MSLSFEFSLFSMAYFFLMGLPGGLLVKNLLAMQEMQVRSVSWEDPLEKEMATCSSFLVWEIPWTEEPGGLYIVYGVTRAQASDTTQ